MGEDPADAQPGGGVRAEADRDQIAGPPVVAGGGRRADDPGLAAAEFNWLVLSIPLNAAMFCPSREFATEELEGYAAAGVRTFLAAHRPAARR
jgi:hypothetical protein